MRKAVGCFFLILVMVFPTVGWAGLTGSPHDFSATDLDNKGGGCSPCHVPHKAANSGELRYILSPRDISQEETFFEDTPGNLPPGGVNYTRGGTLLCYDCHDNHSAVDDDPATTAFTGFGLNRPHDIAFDFNVKTTDYGTWDPPYDNQLITETGYFENYYGATPGLGGHSFQTDPDFGGPIKVGDKLPCGDCHDPHGTTNGAFIRENFGVKSVTNQPASNNTRNGTGNGRALCAACHGYSNLGPPVTFSAISPAYANSNPIPAPPSSVGGVTLKVHWSNRTTPCTDCHPHQYVKAGCNSCHGFPPTTATENYLGGGGAHQRHLDTLGENFECEICHGPDPGSAAWHNEGAGIVSQAKVDIIGQSMHWDPDGDKVTGYNGIASSVTLPSGYEFTAKGGAPQRCYGLACHGAPPTAGAPTTLLWGDDMIDESTGHPEAGDKIEICKWCHDADPAVITIDAGISYVRGPNLMGTKNIDTGTGGDRSVAANWGAEVNGHGLASGINYDYNSVAEGTPGGAAGAEKECTVCHDATYSGGLPAKAHFDGTYHSAEKRLRGTINGISGVAGPDDTCVACHQNTDTDAGTQVSNHGDYPAEPLSFTRVCRQCHEVHGRNLSVLSTTRNLYMVGTWLDNEAAGTWGQVDSGEEARVDSSASGPTTDITTADDVVVFTSRIGGDSFDEIDGAAPDDETDNDDDICGACHTYPDTGGGDHDGTPNYNGDERGNDCTNCHGHNFDDDPLTADAFLPSGCEGCHNYAEYDPDGPGGPAAPAPNVMGDGTNPSGVPTPTHGTPKPFDDGTYGFNVNGHGRDADTNDYSHGDAINKGCLECHNIGDPAGTHLDGTLNGRLTPDDTRNTNSFHLKTDGTPFIVDPTDDYSVQVGFDAACWGRCHTVATKDMRHAKDSDPAANAVQFESHQTGQQPTDTPPMFYDRNLRTLESWDGRNGSDNFNFAPCVSCHNPHGTDVISPRNDQNNKMCIYRWKKPAILCSKCHV